MRPMLAPILLIYNTETSKIFVAFLVEEMHGDGKPKIVREAKIPWNLSRVFSMEGPSSPSFFLHL